MKEALESLLEKYGVPMDSRFTMEKSDAIFDGDRLLPGYDLLSSDLGRGDIPLLYWRMSRSATELRGIVREGAIGRVCLQKSGIVSSAGRCSLNSIIYRELDLFEFFGEGRIQSVFSVFNAGHSVNVIVRMNTGVLCSLEIILDLPDNTESQETHEIVGRGGVASDRVVDSQLSRSSLYCFTRLAGDRYMDTDAELFGFDAEQVGRIRAAFEIYREPGLRDTWRVQHRHLADVVEAVGESAKRCRKIVLV